MDKRIGMIGFGVMGAAMVPRLLEAGFRPVVFDIDPAASDRARGLGCDVAESPAAAVASVVLISLPRPEHVTSVVRGPSGLLGAAAPGSVIVDTSTVDPGTTIANAAAAGDRGVAYLDAPVLGRPRAAGKWTLPVGGDEAAISLAEPVLRTFAARIVHVGASGQGNTLKLLNNLMFGAINAVTCEMFTLGARLGMEPALLYETIVESGAGTVSNLFRELGPKIVDSDFRPDFSVDNMAKDIGLGLDMAHANDLVLGLSEAGQELNRRAQAAGLGGLDTSAVVKIVGTEGAGA